MRKIILVILIHVSLFANPYKKNCVRCHNRMQVGIDKFFYRYLLVYSSEKETKKALKSYLLRPTKKKSLFSEDLVLRYGIKRRSILSKKKLDKAIDIYWDKYNLIGKLK